MENTQDNFVVLLREFNELVKDQPPLKDVKESILKIKANAQIKSSMTGRQIEAITARCDNYLNGTYGRNLSHSA